MRDKFWTAGCKMKIFALKRSAKITVNQRYTHRNTSTHFTFLADSD